MLLGIIEDDALLEVRPRRRIVTQKDAGTPQRQVAREEKRSVVAPLGQTEALLAKLQSRPVLGTNKVKPP